MDRIIKILIVEKKDYCHYFFSKIIRFDNFRYRNASTLDQASDSCDREIFDLIIFNLDINVDGAPVDSTKKIRDFAGPIPIVIVADKNEAEKTVECMKFGAANVIFKPFLNTAKIKQEIVNTLKPIQSENNDKFGFRQDDNRPFDMLKRFYGIVGKSSYTNQLYEVICRIAPIDVNVLILGESGTGKELIARAIHGLSLRDKSRFVAVNCGALPEGLIESSFFGYEKGAFTGADKKRYGHFEEANDGTIFLDEIGSMSKRAQVALLRVLQEQEYTRVGGTKAIKVNVRIIASTNKNLRDAVENGSFRADLYYRLNVISIKTAPLRERKEDISVLAPYFVEQICSKYGIKRKTITPQAIVVLEDYAWPGNVRELENFIEGVLALNPKAEKIRSIDFRKIRKRTEKSFYGESRIPEKLLHLSYEEAKEVFERHYFLHLLEENKGNVTHSARSAEIHPATLHRKIKRLKIRPQSYGNNARVSHLREIK